MENALRWEHARWIAAENPHTEYPDGYGAPILRGCFELPAVPEQAELCVCCVGAGEICINGQPVTDAFFTTPRSTYDKRVLYNRYQVAHLLRAGTNVITAMLGNELYNDIHAIATSRAPWRAWPRMIAQLVCQCQGETVAFGTDRRWKWAKGPITYNHCRIGETYDARLEQDGWQLPLFDDSSWEQAELVSPPGGVLEECRLSAPMRICCQHEAVELANGIYDCGVMCTGWVEFEIEAEEGEQYSILYAEGLHEDGSLAREELDRFNSGPRKRHCDEYIARKGKQCWHPRFVYHSFRYVQISGPHKPLRVTVHEVHTDFKRTGHFVCSDPVFNALHDMCTRTFLNCWNNLPTDNAGRSQGPWTGDNSATAEATLYNFDAVDSYISWMKEFRCVQRPSGQLCGVIPGGYGKNSLTGPLWDSSLVLLPYHLWKYRGDFRAAESLYDCMIRYANYVECLTEDGHIRMGLPDWNTYRTHTDIGVTDTAFLYRTLTCLTEIAQELKRPQDVEYLQTFAARVRQAYRKHYMENGFLKDPTPTGLGITITFGLCTPEEAPALARCLAERVEQDGWHFDCGFHGIWQIPAALSDYGYAWVVARVLRNHEYPGLTWCLDQGLTAVPEEWDISTHSLNQQAYGCLDAWFYRSVAGIRYEADGLVIAPCLLDDVAMVDACTPDVSIHIENGECMIETKRKAELHLKGKTSMLPPGKYTFHI